MSVLSGSSCNCNLTKPHIALKSQYPRPNPNKGSLDQAQPGATLHQPLTEAIVARSLNSKSCQNVAKNMLEPLIEEGYFEYGNFEFKNSNFKKQSGELKAKLELKANIT